MIRRNQFPERTLDTFIADATLKHSGKYDYSESVYTRSRDNIKIICPQHGAFMARASHHLNGSGCPKCYQESRFGPKYTTEEFIFKAEAVHGNRYDYSKVTYTGGSDKIEIGCKDHGYFTQAPTSHLLGVGCPVCGGRLKKSTEDFVKEANIVHPNRYQYTLTEYKTNKTKVAILCDTHGIFYQTPDSHLRGAGCPYCAHETAVAWTKEGWAQLVASKNKTFATFYVVNLTDDLEDFVKVGITSMTFEERYRSGKFPYTYAIVDAIEGSPEFVWDLEKWVLEEYKDFKYLPLKSFGGATECFNKEIIDYLTLPKFTKANAPK